MDSAEYIVELRESFSGIWEQCVEDCFNAEVAEIKEAGARNNPYADAFARLEKAEAEFFKRGTDDGSCQRDVEVYAADVVAAEPEFWKERLMRAHTNVERQAIHSGVLRQWRHDLEAMLERWKETYADEEVAKLFQRFKKRLCAVDKLRQESRQGQAQGLGRGWDLSTGDLMKCDVDALLMWLRLIEKDPELKRICDLIGRSVEREEKMMPAQVMRKEEFLVRTIDRNVREEIDGLTFGRHIEDAVPAELATCADEDLEILFDLKFVEGRILSFDKIGQVEELRTREESQEIPLPVPSNCGPVIVCVDTSGSMHGMPERVAKAVTLAVAMRTRSENRKCFLIQTSTQSLTMDLSASDGLASITQFLSSSFGGGTDADQMIESVVEAMARPGYEKSDMLMVSDLIFGDRVASFAAKMRKQQSRGSRFYALVVRDAYSEIFSAFSRFEDEFSRDDVLRDDAISTTRCGFDKMWRYDPRKKTFREMVDEAAHKEADKIHPSSGSSLLSNCGFWRPKGLVSPLARSLLYHH